MRQEDEFEKIDLEFPFPEHFDGSWQTIEKHEAVIEKRMLRKLELLGQRYQERKKKADELGVHVDDLPDEEE
jgi:hypothetical protein